MTGKSHFIFAAATGGLTAYTFHDNSLLCYGITIGTSMLGGLLPDIDNRRSAIGQALLPLSLIASKLAGHRTFFHSPLFLLIVYALLKYFCHLPGNASEYLIAGLLGGMIGHLFLDMLTVRGIPLFYPFSHSCIAIMGGKSGGKSEVFKLIAVMILTGAIYWYFWLR